MEYQTWIDALRRIVDETAANGGSTTRLYPAPAPATGYALSIRKDAERIVSAPLTLAELAAYATTFDADLQAGFCLGTWEHSGNVYLDLATVEQDRSKALELAREHSQIAIFDLDRKEEIPV